jgi:membrane-bound lytic murein transglycosylase D
MEYFIKTLLRYLKNYNMVTIKLTLCLLCVVMLGGCSLKPLSGFAIKKDCTDSHYSNIDITSNVRDNPVILVAPVNQIETFSPNNLWDRIRIGLGSNSYPKNNDIDKEITLLATNKTALQQLSARAIWYLYYIVEEIEKRNLPMELAFMPIVESSLDSKATSPVGAAGLWQIMPYTGEHLGLSKNKWYDGRYDIIEATNVALNYMEKLYDIFDDWELAFAGFNSGPSRVKSAIAKNKLNNKPTTFWYLDLPTETYNYVTKIIALSSVLKNSKDYGVNFGFLKNSPSITYIDINNHIDLEDIAHESATSINTLVKINPGLLRQITPPDINYKLVVPVEKEHIIINKINNNVIKDIYAKSNKYKVRKNDNLIKIAKKFNTTPASIKEVNKLKTDKIMVGSKLLIPTIKGYNSSASSSKSNTNKAFTINKSKYYHSIQKGDNLHKIASKYNIEISDLITWNKYLATAKYLQIGQKVLIYK